MSAKPRVLFMCTHNAGRSQMAAALLDLNVGFSYGGIIDPVTGNQTPVLQQLYGMLAAVIFITIGGDQWLLGALVKSYSMVPLTEFVPAKDIAALKAHNGDITLHFVLDGNLHDPKFKLDESLMTEVRAGFAKALGVSAEGVVKGAGETAKGIGDALRKLFGGGQPSK